MGAAALPIAMTAASTAASMAGQARQASAVNQQSRLQELQNSLQLATQERNRQDLLQENLARQNVRNAATGIDAASGSALGLANAAKAQTDRDLSLLYTDADLDEQRRAMTGSGLGARSTQSLLTLGRTGMNLFSSLWR
jgi:hypothetical protein